MPPRVSAERGFSLIEMAVAVAILSVAVIGLFRVFDHGLSAAAADRDRLLAALVARNRAEELEAGLRGLPAEVTLARRGWLIATERRATSGGFEEVTLRVMPAEGGGGARLVLWLPAG